MDVAARPRLTVADALAVAERSWGITGTATPLAGERDRNFRLTSDDGTSYVLKIAHPDERRAVLDFQNAALAHLAQGGQPRLYPAVIHAASGETMPTLDLDGRAHLVRLVTWLDGRPASTIEPRPPALHHEVGARLGVMDRELATFSHEAMHRFLQWDSKHAFMTIRERAPGVEDAARRRLVLDLLDGIASRLLPLLPGLPTGVIHNDANDHNLLVGDDGRLAGIIDFGDMVHTYRVCEPANAAAYLMLEHDDPSGVVDAIASGYHATCPLEPTEIEALLDLAVLRLCLSVTMAAHQRRRDPENEYLGVTEAPAWALLETLPPSGPRTVRLATPRCETLARKRTDLLCRGLGTSYGTPLHIVRGAGAYLFDDAGRGYLDCVNNVCHVGHCHPRVVAAARAQMAALNTNTRYLHETILRYAERLAATVPDPLSVCFFVNSGSEANDLGLRLARTHTGAKDVVVVGHAYHGNLTSLIDISPYKYGRAGGRGAPATTHEVPLPDCYRGPHGADDPEAGRKYAAHVARVIEAIPGDGHLAAFIAESFPGCAGQVDLPAGYLEHAYRHARRSGGVCIADEVQVGFGRVGTHMWAFETQDVVPDIVTMGKPIGNGHPLGAVVTTREIATSFDNGMEYFNTFGGNPVSCAIGLAVLDIIESEGLQAHAKSVGAHFLAGLRDLATRHAIIGDVRGRGLFLGVELVRDRTTREPAPAEAKAVVERAKDLGVLLSTDGPFENVIKIKPPLVFSRENADEVVRVLDAVM